MMDEDTIAWLAEAWISGHHEGVLDAIAAEPTKTQAARAAVAIGLMAGIDGPEQLLRALEERADCEGRTIPHTQNSQPERNGNDGEPHGLA